jgi:hypothetical protein
VEPTRERAHHKLCQGKKKSATRRRLANPLAVYDDPAQLLARFEESPLRLREPAS